MKAGPVHNLKSLQRQMMAALMTPLTRTDGISRRNTEVQKAARLIKPNPRLKAFERLEIYNRSYWFRLLESLSDDFPGLVAVLGWTAFERMAKAYLLECPSASFTLRDLGSRLEAWLRAHPRHTGPNPVLALDMAQLEWAHIVAFDAPGERTLQPEDLADLGQGMKIGLQRPLAGSIKRNNVCPFQLRHIECQNPVRPHMARVCAQPRFEPAAQIAQSKRFRRTLQKIRLRHALEGGPA